MYRTYAPADISPVLDVDTPRLRGRGKIHSVNEIAEKCDPTAKCLKTLERVKGIEPSSSAWKAVALPLSYTRIGTSEAGRQTVEGPLSGADPASPAPGWWGR
jgi:hypothetical protein